MVEPICQLNIPIRRTGDDESFDIEMEELLEYLITQGSYFLMHLEETIPNEQWNFFLVNTFYEECSRKLRGMDSI